MFKYYIMSHCVTSQKVPRFLAAYMDIYNFEMSHEHKLQDTE
jgi:hypothetical protein